MKIDSGTIGLPRRACDAVPGKFPQPLLDPGSQRLPVQRAGRGKGAAVQCVHGGRNVKLWAVGDAFRDRVDSALTIGNEGDPNKIKDQLYGDQKYRSANIQGVAFQGGGTIFTDNGNNRNSKAPQLPVVHVAIEGYGRIARELERKQPVTLEMDMQNKFYGNDDAPSFNVIAEIPGTDPKLKDEVVIIGGHFDSWHGGTGATDNAAGSATMMEAMRILKTLNVSPRRTIRIGLWTGEEQGLFGSRAYVRQHFGYSDSTGNHFTPEHAKFAAYFNVDNGTGKIRGVYQQMNADVAPIFNAWMGPFKDIGMKTLTISNTGGTDHQSFDAVGLPGFQYIQDGIEYNTRTHHSNADVYERIQAEDMKFNSAVLAAFAWQAAQRDDKLPRKAAPAPRTIP